MAASRAWLREAGHAAGLLAALGAAVWATGEPLLFPSLGPTAYLFARRPTAAAAAPRRVVGGHAVGVVAGLAAFHALGGPALGGLEPGSLAAGRLAASGVCAVALTAAGMALTDTMHPPACATTLIVALGVLSTPRAGALVVLAVVALVVQQRLLERLSGSAPTAGESPA